MSALLLLQVRLLLLAALAGEHLLLLGPPGTAKSELSRRMARLTGGTYFERLLTRFSVPEELFGPLSMKGKPHCTCSVVSSVACCFEDTAAVGLLRRPCKHLDVSLPRKRSSPFTGC